MLVARGPGQDERKGLLFPGASQPCHVPGTPCGGPGPQVPLSAFHLVAEAGGVGLQRLP